MSHRTTAKSATRPSADAYDVIVVGGGPAGSTAATVAAQHGHRVLLLERERFPRYHIGESLMPATYWTLDRLGVLDRIEGSAFTEKFSVQFYSPRGRAAQPFFFHEFDPHVSSKTWQVERSAFDATLLDNAAEKGVEVVQPANVRSVTFDGERATGVRAQLDGGDTVELAARVVVDASGQSSILAGRFGLREVDPKLRHASFFTRYRGAVRDSGPNAGATLHFWTEAGKSWFWFIPLPGDVTSVGVIGGDGYLLGRDASPQEVFDEELSRCPALASRLESAEQVMEMRVLRDFSYISRRIAGDGWVMVGDAFGFLDPIYSTGVFLALKSGELAADAIHEALRADDVSGPRLGAFGDGYLEGMEALRRMVYAYYDGEFSFNAFLERFPDCREPLINLLVGNVFRKPMGELFESMEQMCDLPEARRLEAAGGAG